MPHQPRENAGNPRFLSYQKCSADVARAQLLVYHVLLLSWETMTLTEKIMARASGKKSVQPGDNVWVNVDVLMTHDVCGPGTIGVFKREFGANAKVWDREKIVIIPDHYIFTADSKSNRNVDILRDFVREQGLKYFYDVIDDPDGHWVFDASKGQLKRQYGSNFAGVCHTALPAK